MTTHGRSDADFIERTHNTARFFTESRHIAWILMIATVAWGVYGYLHMPQRKDPIIPIIYAAVVTPWPGTGAAKVEQLVTRKVEEKLAESASVEKIEGVSRNSLSVVYITLRGAVTDTSKVWDDLGFKLNGIRDLPDGAGPIYFLRDFGDTASLMLTVASPEATELEVAVRAQPVRQAIEQARAQAAPSAREGRATLVAVAPSTVSHRILRRARDLLLTEAAVRGVIRDPRPIEGPGFVGLDGAMSGRDDEILGFVQRFVQERLRVTEIHPDVWRPALIREPQDAQARLAAVAGARYTYRELDQFTELIKRTLQTVPQVSKVTRDGILEERVFLEYSQERLASYGTQPAQIRDILGARNINLPGGFLEFGGKNVAIDASGEFKSEKEIGDVLFTTTSSGTPVYVRDAVEIARDYESPPRLLNFYTWHDAQGRWHRSRAVTLAAQQRPGGQIAAFGQEIDAALASLKQRLPSDLIMARTSDQPRQVREAVSLFMRSLYEAIILVVLVALVGFWEWRSALLMALSIPLTLAMTFGMAHMLNIDIQQVSIASLIIALGLLIDDPVVAGDAIKRELAAGHRPIVAAWLGPTRLGKAILFATVTNIVAYLPFLLISPPTGNFIYSLPVVLTCSLVASRIVSMTFVPLLGYYLLRPDRKPQPPMEERRRRGFTGLYYRVASWGLEHRWLALAGCLVFLAIGGYMGSFIKQRLLPEDLAYLSWVDVWLPEDAPLSATLDASQRAERIVREVATEYGRRHSGEGGRPREVLTSITTFVGGGGPRWWFSIFPEMQQPNYAQLIIETEDKHDTKALVPLLQRALSAGVPGARLDVRELEASNPIGIPVSLRISGQDIPTLRSLADRVKEVLRTTPGTRDVRDDWGDDSLVVKLKIDPDRANLAGISNLDVASSSAAGMNGYSVTTLREGDKQIPVMVRLRMEERVRLADIQNLYVFSLQGPQKIPLRQVSTVEYQLEPPKLRSRNQFRTITVAAFPTPGTLPSDVFSAIKPRLHEIEKTLPPGYKFEIGGEEEEQLKAFGDMTVAMLISMAAIFLVLVIQFRHAVKPFIVFAAIPFGVIGALAGLAIMRTSFGFMAFLGVASLVGVIVSHVIVLFDFIEEMHEKGEPLREALLDAGIVRLRPVLITVGGTVFGLVPLALHGGPLWEPLSYTQIGGLTLATFVTLLLVPVLYTIFVLDLRIIDWEKKTAEAAG